MSSQEQSGNQVLRLRVRQGSERADDFVVGATGATVGRGLECDIRLDHPWVSREHARIHLTDGGWVFTQLGAASGTRVDTVLLDQGESVPIWDGSMLTVGPWSFLVEGAGVVPPQAAAESGDAPSHETRASLLRGIHDSSTGKRNTAWTQFVKNYGGIIRGYAGQLGIEGQEQDDVCQDVFLALHQLESGVNYDRSLGHFRSYLRVATRHAAITRLRKMRPQSQDAMDHIPSDAATDGDWDHHWAEGMLLRALEVMQRTMRPTHYDAFERHGRRGESAADVAATLGLTAANVRAIKARGIRRLRKVVASLEETSD